MSEVITGRSPLEMLIDSSEEWSRWAIEMRAQRRTATTMRAFENAGRLYDDAMARSEAFLQLATDVEAAMEQGRSHGSIDLMIASRVRGMKE